MDVGYTKQIEDDVFEAAIKRLFNKGEIKEITRLENSVVFLKWTRGRDFGAGIVFSESHQKPVIFYQTIIEPLSEIGWYYYETE